MTHRIRQDDARAGFTLVEMLVVLVIVAMALAAGGAAMARRDPAPTAAQSARQLQALLLQTRSEAIRQGRDAAVDLDVGAPSFAARAIGRPLHLPAGTAMAVRAALVEGSGDGRRATVIFRADGSASGGEVTLTDARGRSAVVAVDWFTGLARLRP